MMDKQIMKAIHFPNSIWTKVTKTKYKHEGNIWDMKYLQDCAQSWNAVIKVLDIVRNGLNWEIGDGTRIQVLDNPWVDHVPLKYIPAFICTQEELQGKKSHFSSLKDAGRIVSAS